MGMVILSCFPATSKGICITQARRINSLTRMFNFSETGGKKLSCIFHYEGTGICLCRPPLLFSTQVGESRWSNKVTRNNEKGESHRGREKYWESNFSSIESLVSVSEVLRVFSDSLSFFFDSVSSPNLIQKNK